MPTANMDNWVYFLIITAGERVTEKEEDMMDGKRLAGSFIFLLRFKNFMVKFSCSL